MVNPRTVVTPGLARARGTPRLPQGLRLISWGDPCLLRGPSFKGGPSLTETPCPTVLKYRRLLFWVKLRRTQPEQMSSGLPLQADIAQYSRHVSKVLLADLLATIALQISRHRLLVT